MVLQLSGCKHWRIFSPQLVQFPTKEQVFRPNLSSLSVLLELDLTAGSVLYIPRGFVHEAATNCSLKSMSGNQQQQTEGGQGEGLDDSVRGLSMHLSMGIEVAGRTSVDVLLIELLRTITQDIEKGITVIDEGNSQSLFLTSTSLTSCLNELGWKATMGHTESNSLFQMIEIILAAIRLTAEDTILGIPLRKPLALSTAVVRSARNPCGAMGFFNLSSVEIIATVSNIAKYITGNHPSNFSNDCIQKDAIRNEEFWTNSMISERKPEISNLRKVISVGLAKSDNISVFEAEMKPTSTSSQCDQFRVEILRSLYKIFLKGNTFSLCLLRISFCCKYSLLLSL